MYTLKWTREADNAIKKVPFFVRKKVRKRVEKEALENGKKSVGIEDEPATRRRFMTHMDAEVKGYQLDTCFGPAGCPHSSFKNNSQNGKRFSEVFSLSDLNLMLKNSSGTEF